MRAWIARMTEDNIDQSAIEKAGEILKNGGLAAFPTETVYGLGGNALDAKASEKIYAAKGRPSDNPLIVHIGRMEDLETVAANVPESARKLAAACWPGPLTMIFEKTNAVPLETTGGLTSVAVRYPSNKVANALILAGGGFIAAPSANTSGRPSPTKAEHVIEDLGDKIDCIIDGGDAEIGLESTIVDFTEEIPTILRPGYYNKEMLEKVLGTVRVDPGILTLVFEENGELEFEVTAAEGDPMFDEIGSRLKIKEIQTDEKKQELLTQLQLYYKVFFLGEEIE